MERIYEESQENAEFWGGDAVGFDKEKKLWYWEFDENIPELTPEEKAQQDYEAYINTPDNVRYALLLPW